MNEQDQIRTAMAELTDLLGSIARTADEKNRERCPYKRVDLRCTYSGGCQNQRRSESTMLCNGDDFVRFSLTTNP